MYLLLAGVWLVAGVVLFVLPLAGYSTGRIGPLGYLFCFVLAVFNIARWYASRSAKEDEAASRIAQAARQRGDRRHQEAVYDPNLDFTKKDEPPPSPPNVQPPP